MSVDFNQLRELGLKRSGRSRLEVFGGFVELVDYMGSDLSVINSARVSYGKRSVEFGDRDEKLLRYLWSNGHTSPFRHGSLQFHIKAPIFVLRQWMKHQVGCAWNEISGRYVKFSAEFYEPEIFRKPGGSSKQGSEGEVLDNGECLRLYRESLQVQYSSYELLLSKGVCKEQARMVLPLSLYSECYWSCSLQALLHFLKLREDEHSQYEIREYARLCRELGSIHFPRSLSLL